MNALIRLAPAWTACCLTLGCVGAPEPIDELEAREHMREVDLSELEDVELTQTVPTPEDVTICTLEARPAALVRVVQPNGQALEPVGGEAVVLYRRWTGAEWGKVEGAYCIDDDCTEAAVGYGTPGVYLIGAFACGDMQLTLIAAGKTDDGCHVETVHVTMILDEVAPVCRGVDEYRAAF